MNSYPKQILSIEQQLQSFKDAGMIIPSDQEAKNILQSVGYYRLRGYTYTLYDNATKSFIPGTNFEKVMKLYDFDTHLSNLLFSFLSKIEIALRVRLTESLLIYGDALILNDPTPFKDKKIYWQNYSSVCSEIARSHDVFIKHNFQKHDGKIPLWAAVEVLSFGSLSRLIKNLNTGKGSAYSRLAGYYKYTSKKGNPASPSNNMLSSWIQALVILRNTCAHNARIYNRSFNTSPVILQNDVVTPKPKHKGLYQLLLAMKYLRPSDIEWNDFVTQLTSLIQTYANNISLKAINFPNDWYSHLCI